MKSHGDNIVKYVNEWTLDGDLDKKVEELLWTNVLIYAVVRRKRGLLMQISTSKPTVSHSTFNRLLM